MPEKGVCRGILRAWLLLWRADGRALVGRRVFLGFQGDRGSLLPRFCLFSWGSENYYNYYIFYTIYVPYIMYVYVYVS